MAPKRAISHYDFQIQKTKVRRACSSSDKMYIGLALKGNIPAASGFVKELMHMTHRILHHRIAQSSVCVSWPHASSLSARPALLRPVDSEYCIPVPDCENGVMQTSV